MINLENPDISLVVGVVESSVHRTEERRGVAMSYISFEEFHRTVASPSPTIPYEWYTQSIYFADEYGTLLPAGAVIDLMPHSPHAGIIGYTGAGQQVVAHNSKKDGKGVISSPEYFNDGHIPVRVARLPRSPDEGHQIWQNAVNDVRRGVRWMFDDNCRDFVNRAVSGRNGSSTRDALLCVTAIVAGFSLFAS
jgi:hypothetical protein